jgi:hypothetical protein
VVIGVHRAAYSFVGNVFFLGEAMTLTTDWNQLVDTIEKGWAQSRRSSRISLLPELLPPGVHFKQRGIKLHLSLTTTNPNAVTLILKASDSRDFDWEIIPGSDEYEVKEESLLVAQQAVFHFDGLRLKLSPQKKRVHSAFLKRSKSSSDISYKITLMLDEVALSPVLAESNLQRSAQRDITVRELKLESQYFTANCGPEEIVIAGEPEKPVLEIECEGNQPGRDMVFTVTLKVNESYAPGADNRTVQVNHAPFIVAQSCTPRMVPEAGTILAQWRSDDSDGAQWRFGVDTVTLYLPPQAVGEVMVRGARFQPAGAPSPIDKAKTVGYRFARRTELTVTPSREDRRYTVHPGDMLSVLRDARLERLVTELAYPLELTYQRTPELRRTVIVTEIGTTIGQPAVSLSVEAISEQLGRFYKSHLDFEALVELQRTRHLAARANFRNRIAQFPLSDASDPDRKLKLNLREGLSAVLRGQKEKAALVAPLPDGAASGDLHLKLPNYVAPPNEKHLPAGLLYSLEFASELVAVLRAPSTTDVTLTELTLSVLGASGSMQASFDEGRTVFNIVVENGQLSQLVKTRYGRVGCAWNKCRHVVVYERSTAPGAQFQNEQLDEWLIGRPMLRKMEEYCEVIEKRRLFDIEPAGAQNQTGCVHSFHFATQIIYVNGAWGRDLGNGYEIPLYNPLDTSGFYPRPWMGPVTQGGGGVLSHNWHEKPENLVFYTNTEEGKGADSDQWAAVMGTDLDNSPGFFGLAHIDRLGTATLLEQRQVPGYNLEAASNPRFSMRVRPDGTSNLMHGRGGEELVAALRTIQIERTLATARVDLTPGSLLMEYQVAPGEQSVKDASDKVWPVAKAAAELKSIDATIRSILDDAAMLWKTLKDSKTCETFQDQLIERVNNAFKECRGRLEIALVEKDKILPNPQKDVPGLSTAFRLFQQMPDAMLDAVCAQGERAIALLRDRLAELMVKPAEVRERWNQLEQVYLVLPVRSLLRRTADAMHGGVQTLVDLSKALEEIEDSVETAGKDSIAALTDIKARREELIKSVAPAQLQASALAFVKETQDKLNDVARRINVLHRETITLNLPAQAEGLLQLRDHVASRLAIYRQKFADAAVELEASLRLIEADDSVRAIENNLRDGVEKACGPRMEADIQRLVGQVATVLPKPKNSIDALIVVLQEQEGDLRAGNIGGSLQGLFADELAAYQKLKEKLEDGAADMSLQVRSFDDALRAMQEQLTLKSGGRAPLALLMSERWKTDSGKLEGAALKLAESLNDAAVDVRKDLKDLNSEAQTQLGARNDAVVGKIKAFDCKAWSSFAAGLEQEVVNATSQLHDAIVHQVSRIFDAGTRLLVNDLVTAVQNIDATGNQLLQQAKDAVLPKAGQAIKLARLLSDPPELPQLTIRTDRLECVYGDLKDQIETSPFVMRLREVDAGIKELGIALPSRKLFMAPIPDPLEGLNFSQVIRNAALDFQNLMSRFKLPSLPDGAIRISHKIDPRNRSAHVKAEINHEFNSTEALFEIMSVSVDVRRPKLVAVSDFDVAQGDAGKAQTSASFSGDWILSFEGQPMVTFVNAAVQYSDKTGFKFDLDPSKIEPHPSLKFISDLIKATMPKVPENIEVVKNSEGVPVGASIVQNQAFGPLNALGVSIGETVISSHFGLRLVEGKMHIDISFGIGHAEAPAFLQIGAYSGGGWLTARAWTNYDQTGAPVPGYQASFGVTLGSSQTFRIAGVAYGSYDLRMFVEASFGSPDTGQSARSPLVAGLRVNGSARILGYLSAYLSMLLQVEHQSDGTVKGSGRLDVKIDVCWCYSVRVNRSVDQTM